MHTKAKSSKVQHNMNGLSLYLHVQMKYIFLFPLLGNFIPRIGGENTSFLLKLQEILLFKGILFSLMDSYIEYH